MEKKILHLTLKKKWFDLIKSGEKKEEYRELKHYWYMRLCEEMMYDKIFTTPTMYLGHQVKEFKHFDIIRFTNGYAKNAPTFDIECKGIRVGAGNPEWGAPLEPVFILSLGNIIN